MIVLVTLAGLLSALIGDGLYYAIGRICAGASPDSYTPLSRLPPNCNAATPRICSSCVLDRAAFAGLPAANPHINSQSSARTMPGPQTARKRRLPWDLPLHGKLPSQADVKDALHTFRDLRTLIFFEGHVGSNFGFGATISFNPVRHGAGEDFIEVALAEAALKFQVKDPQGWSWSEDVRSLVLGSDTAVGVKEGEQEGRSRAFNFGLKTQLGLEAGATSPLHSAKASGNQGFDLGGAHQKSKTRSTERSRTDLEHWAQMTRPDGMFGLRLRSPQGDDLIRFNPHLDRTPILHPPDPNTLSESDVQVTASVQAKGELRHAVRIVDAAGKWARATESRNKQIISELLLNKALSQPVRLWPRKRRR